MMISFIPSHSRDEEIHSTERIIFNCYKDIVVLMVDGLGWGGVGLLGCLLARSLGWLVSISTVV